MSIDDTLIAKQTLETDLTAMPNVNGVGVGMKWVNGVPTDQPAILVFVQKKLPETNVISMFSASDMIPPVIDGIPTDVIEVGDIVLQNFRQRIRPIKPGYSTSQKDVTAGTIGGFFIDRQGDPVVLSNNHVLANENRAKVGDYIYQPGILDAGKINMSTTGWTDPVSALPYYATLKQFVPLSATGVNAQDSAIGIIHPKIIKAGLIDPIYPVINQPLRGFATPVVNTQVQKCGRTTGYSTGRIMALNASFSVAYSLGSVKFNNCVVCSAMSSGGDSGSIIADMSMNAVALLFAGSPKVTIGNPIQTIQQQYGLSLWKSTQLAPSMELDDGKWTIYSTLGKITQATDAISLSCPANGYCVMERAISRFSYIDVAVNTGNDLGATWGPGISVHFANGGCMKVNLRRNGSFGGYLNGSEILNIGKTAVNTEYRLRIRKTETTYVGEVKEGSTWYTVIEVPITTLGDVALKLRVGKTDAGGSLNNHNPAGDAGQCSFRDLDVT